MLISEVTAMKYIVSLTGIVCITALECVAIKHGLDGVILAGSLAAIGTICGYTITGKNNKKG